MLKISEIKKYSADKLVLLGLLVLSLLLARLIIASKSRILFSGPITLEYTGLSVSIPSGKGWINEKSWRKKGDSFILSSIFDPGIRKVVTSILCQYILASNNSSTNTQFDQKALNLDGKIVKTDRITNDTLTIDWVHIESQKKRFNVLFGIAKLPNNRQLNIEVRQSTGDLKSAKELFSGIVKNLKFENNPLLDSGSEIIAKIKQKGLIYYSNKIKLEKFFLIKDGKKDNLGFAVDIIVDSGDDSELNIHGASAFYTRGKTGSEQVTFFKSKNDFNEFIWKIETSGPLDNYSNEVVLKENGIITIRKLSQRAVEKNYQINAFSIPDILSEFVFFEMLANDYQEIIVDIIEADGTISPALIKKESTKTNSEQVFRVEFLNNKAASQLIYFDNQGQIWKKLFLQQDISLEMCNIEDIAREFPERADYTMLKDKILNKNAF